jgi:hypothetical protein
MNGATTTAVQKTGTENQYRKPEQKVGTESRHKISELRAAPLRSSVL